MVDYVKQDMSLIWAELGDYVAPLNTKITEGWLVEVPPRQYWNWIENRQDKMLAYLAQKGIPEWDATTEYLINKSYVQYGGVVYKAILTGTNKVPSSEPTYWSIAFATSTSSLEALKAVTPAADRLPYFNGTSTATTTPITSLARSLLSDSSQAAARTTIGAQEVDATLTAIAGLTTAANKLPYFSGVDIATTTDLTAFGRSLIDDADATAARTTLGLGTAATATVTTSSIDTTANRLLKVGDFGLGSVGPGTPLIANINLTGGTVTGFYRTDSTTTGTLPAGLTFAGGIYYLEIRKISINNSAQFLTTTGATPRYFVRASTGADAFGAWTEFVKVGDILPATTNVDTNLTNGAVQAIDSGTPGTFNPFQPKTGTMVVYSDGTNHVQFYNTASGSTWRRFKSGAGAWTTATTLVDFTSVGLVDGVSFAGVGSITVVYNGGYSNIGRSSTGVYTISSAFSSYTTDAPFVAMANGQRCIVAGAGNGTAAAVATYGYNNETPTDSSYVCVIGQG